MNPQRKIVVIAAILPVTTITWGAVIAGFALLSPAWAREYSASHGEITLAVTLCQLAQGAASPLAGIAVTKVSTRTLLVVGVTLTALGLSLAALTTAAWQVVVLYASLLAVGTALTGPLVTTALTVRIFADNRGFASGIVISGVALASFIMAPAISALLHVLTWRNTELMLAAFCVALLLPLIWFAVPKDVGELAAESGPAPEETARSFANIARDRRFWGITLSYTPLLLLFNGAYFNLGFALSDLGVSAAQTSAMVATIGAAALISLVLFGALSDRMRHEPLLIASVVIMCGLAVLTALHGTYSLLMISMPVWAFFIGGTAALMPAVLAKTFGVANYGRANGLYMIFQSAAVCGSIIAGYGRDFFGNYHDAFEAMLVLVPVCLVALYFSKLGSDTPNSRSRTSAV